ncbi:MAG: alpha/beta fold hydrolase [Clostridia bacterium]
MLVKVNNININYEVCGQGSPIILLHGNQETHEIFDKLIEKMQVNYTVYALDSRCHGKSDNPDKISYNLMAGDTIAFIKKLKISKPILYGFSDGGIVGLLIAIKEPDILSNLIISGANITPDATTKLDTILTKLFYFFTKNKLIKMMLDEPNIPLEDLQRITIPVHVLAGEKDVIRLNHTKLIADNIKNSTLEIVKGENHGSYIIHSDKIYGIIKKYLEKI